MKDVQSELETRGLKIQCVGVSNYKIPCKIINQTTLCEIKLGVSLDANKRGIHMSRLCDIIEHLTTIDNESISAVLKKSCEELEASYSKIEIESSIFLKKNAPVTEMASRLPYDIKIEASIDEDSIPHICHTICIPITLLCPCSKAISIYGAHNQRGVIKITINGIDTSNYVEIIRNVERNSPSAELFEVLKRPDEKAVTENAYENPKFVEDVIRDATLLLRDMFRNNDITVEVTSFESIHAHNAFAKNIITG